jgi:hypothetical protein
MAGSNGKELRWFGGEGVETKKFEEDDVRKRREQIMAIQEQLAKYLPQGRSLADELIEERRAEARRESEKNIGSWPSTFESWGNK